MDSAVLLDLLGNENRRRILRLLAHKPCYVTEISEYLGVSPKAVIDHLRKLEDAGLIESRTDDQRRKYFHISQSFRLEVNISPYGFGAKSAYPASRSLDTSGCCPHVALETSSPSEMDGLEELAMEFDHLQELENELSLAQRWVHGRMTEVLDRLNDALDIEADSRFYAEVLAAVTTTTGTTAEISDEVDAPDRVVEDVLRRLAERNVVSRNGGSWELA